jgi:hypothetical protein
MNPDILSSASLILAVIALLYTIWQPDIQKAKEFDEESHYPDIKKNHEKLKQVLSRQAFPLATGASFMAVIFLPEFINRIVYSFQIIAAMGLLNSLSTYDVILAAFLIVEISFLFLMVHLWVMASELIKKNRKCNLKKSQYLKESQPNPRGK